MRVWGGGGRGGDVRGGERWGGTGELGGEGGGEVRWRTKRQVCERKGSRDGRVGVGGVEGEGGGGGEDTRGRGRGGWR